MLNILTTPNEILTKAADDVIFSSNKNDTASSALKVLIDEMIKTATEAGLVGLAANQVGILQNVFVVDMGYTGHKKDVKDFVVFVNARIKGVKEKGRKAEFEGCGSIPNMLCLVERWNEIVVEAQDEDGEYFNMVVKGMNARQIQHEADHVKGILISSKSRQNKIVR